MITTKIVIEVDHSANIRCGKINGLGDEQNRRFVHFKLRLSVFQVCPGWGSNPHEA
jgi:hypothetical protein